MAEWRSAKVILLGKKKKNLKVALLSQNLIGWLSLIMYTIYFNLDKKESSTHCLFDRIFPFAHAVIHDLEFEYMAFYV